VEDRFEEEELPSISFEDDQDVISILNDREVSAWELACEYGCFLGGF